MGLGKTPQLLAFMLHLKAQSMLTKPVLIACPTSVINNWEHEIKKFAPSLSIYIHHGDKRSKGIDFAKNIENKQLVLTSYALLYRDSKTLEKIDWQEQTWFCIGLPAFDCKFNISNDLLYLEEDAEGNCKLKKQEFTGEVNFNTTIINPLPDGDNYIISFKALFYKGLLSESDLIEFKIQSHEEYEKGFEEYKQKLIKTEKRRSSKWFRYFYVPYYYIMKSIFLIIAKPLDFLFKCFCKLVDFITPIKPE
jgi:SNF2 family DNA or RNA helicase